MATATNKAHAAKSVARSRNGASKPPSLDFLVYADNAGGFHWEIVAGSGESLAQSPSFASRDDAERAAHTVSRGVRAARSEPGVAQARQRVTV